MESYIKIKATVPEMSEFFEKDNGVRHYEIIDKRYTQAELDAMSEDKYNSEVFTFSVCYRHMELDKPLTGTFTIRCVFFQLCFCFRITFPIDITVLYLSV